MHKSISFCAALLTGGSLLPTAVNADLSDQFKYNDSCQQMYKGTLYYYDGTSYESYRCVNDDGNVYYYDHEKSSRGSLYGKLGETNTKTDFNRIFYTYEHTAELWKMEGENLVHYKCKDTGKMGSSKCIVKLTRTIYR